MWKFKIGDKLLDRKEGSIIEIIDLIKESPTRNEGYEINVDDIYWEPGVTDNYLLSNCDLLN